jgi:CRISPR-associated protein Cas2
MYDIESTKVRNQIAKYLLREGCTRVQKSIFLADLPLDTYNRMRSELAQVQECYENQDSILIVPISTDYLQSMKVIGQTLDVDLILKNRNTLFF